MGDSAALSLHGIVALPFAAALLTFALARSRRAVGLPLIAAAGIVFALTLRLLSDALSGAAAVVDYDWIPALGIHLRYRGDSFGLFFAAVISGIGLLVGGYSVAYLPSSTPLPRLTQFYAALSAFMGSMLGIALADDLILFFVFWELTSLTSFFLIGFYHEHEVARRGALTALLVTAIGGLALMAGAVMIGLGAGTFTISELASGGAAHARLIASPLFLPAALLVLAGAFTKSAQVPFHFWLPGAMVAPTPVSTYLHAAAMVKAGVFAVGRMLPVLQPLDAWSPILVSVGLATFALGAYQAFRETDLKLLLARTTFSALGLMMLVYGLNDPGSDSLQILSHALYKGALFLVAGIVEHAAHTRDLRELGGLRHELRITFWICLLAVLSMAGVPPLFGFLAKEALYTALLQSEVLRELPILQWSIIGVAVLSNALIFAVAVKIVAGVFLGSKRPEFALHEPERAGLWLPPAALAGLALVLGMLGATPLTESLVGGLSSAPAAAPHVSLWPAQLAPLVLSLITIALGAMAYRWRETIENWQLRVSRLPSAQTVWDGVLDTLSRSAEAYASRWQNGSLRWYFTVVAAFSSAIVLFALWRAGLTVADAAVDLRHVTDAGLAVGALIAACSLLVMRAATRLAAAIALTAVGFLVALMYVIYRSPDILLTQILIETVSTIFLLQVLYFMPPFRADRASPAGRLVNATIAGAFGVMMFLLVLLCTTPALRATRTIAADYLARSLPEAGGRNVVNVIIVDFRAMDTTGEITVLVVVGLCIFGMLRARRTSA